MLPCCIHTSPAVGCCCCCTGGVAGSILVLKGDASGDDDNAIGGVSDPGGRGDVDKDGERQGEELRGVRRFMVLKIKVVDLTVLGQTFRINYLGEEGASGDAKGLGDCEELVGVSLEDRRLPWAGLALEGATPMLSLGREGLDEDV